MKFPGADAVLGPEMRSTGEVMGHANKFGHAFWKAQLATNTALPMGGNVVVTVNDKDKGGIMKIARDLHHLGFHLLSTGGTADALEIAGVPVERIKKLSEGSPNVVDLIQTRAVHLVINTPQGGQSYNEGRQIRQATQRHGIPLITTLSAATAFVQSVRAVQQQPLEVISLQEHHQKSDLPS